MQIRKAVVENILEALDENLDQEQGQVLILGKEALAIEDTNAPTNLQIIVPKKQTIPDPTNPDDPSANSSLFDMSTVDATPDTAPRI